MLKVATFSRTSTDNISQSKSIENQEDVYKSWIEKNNCVLYKNYIDEGISGTKGKYRVEWKELIQDGKEKKYDILLRNHIVGLVEIWLKLYQLLRNLEKQV